MWKNGSRCHPRSRLSFTVDVSTDISCNIMPPPLHPPPSHHLSAIQHTCRHKIPHVFFLPLNMTISFPSRPKESLQAVLRPTLWAKLKRNVGIVYTNGLNECVAARPNSQWECSVTRAFPFCRSSMRLNWHLTWMLIVQLSYLVVQKRGLIYTRHTFFIANNLCSCVGLCLKRPQQMPYGNVGEKALARLCQ